MNGIMKRMKIVYAVVLLSAALLLPCCNRDMDELPEGDVPGTETGTAEDITQGYSLHLKVGDAGYRSEVTGSRATDDNLKTTFEEGDKLGLYVVNAEGKVLYSNVPYTLIGKEWLAPHNVRLKDFPLKVYAYYPYVKDEVIEGKVTAPTTEAVTDYTATQFFQPYLTGLDITDQSTPERYRQADVMVCEAEIASETAAASSLSLSMKHQMGLVMIKLPVTVTSKITYKIADKSDYVWSGSVPANLSEENLNVQALRVDNIYRYLFKPGKVEFSGEFSTNGVKKQYSVGDGEEEVTIEAGRAKTYNILASIASESPIEVGDFYMSDGTLRSKGAYLTDEEREKCVGIVYFIGTFPNTVNGRSRALVTGLEQKSAIWSKSYNSVYTDGEEGEGFKGYTATDRWESYLESASYPVMSVAYKSLSAVTLPSSKTSGWYIPSVDELKELSNSVDIVNSSVEVLGSSFANKVTVSGWAYWSSASSKYTHMWIKKMGSTGGPYEDYKTQTHIVRLVFAF